ncbi:class III extradiol ring-cleavage dioxygenase family protein [Motilibacter aurantiacus]|uniref:hypothetical protein n=1 Tax=Motilibacter aurantiacus TaxID=2714955 RepID=UPI00140E309D|nr:hypothetical protein [Motilibacter aurantiacus]NHC44542.1 hypothetical protein [Motilibacter aurantiacus]
MLVAAAVVPHPPALVPEVAAGAAAELAELRAACDRAVAALVAAGPDTVVVVAGAPRTGTLPATARADLTPYGLPLVLGGGPGPERLPLGAAIATWLLDRAGWAGRRELLGVAADEPPAACRDLGRRAVAEGRVALLVAGDGSARREAASPRRPDPRAVPFDDATARALGSADASALLAVGQDDSAALAAGGRAAWQVLAGAAGERAYDAELLLSTAPYGVCYHVATWALQIAEADVA